MVNDNQGVSFQASPVFSRGPTTSNAPPNSCCIQHLGSTSRQNHSKVIFAPREVSLGEGGRWGDKVTSHTLQPQMAHYRPIHEREETEAWRLLKWAIMRPLSVMTVMDQSKLTPVQRLLTWWHPLLFFSETGPAICSIFAIEALIERCQSNRMMSIVGGWKMVFLTIGILPHNDFFVIFFLLLFLESTLGAYLWERESY